MVELYEQYPYPGSFLLLFFLGFFRFVPIVIIAPFFGAKIMPAPVRVGIAIALTVVFLPHLIYYTPIPLKFDTFYLALIFKELAIGLILAFFISVPFFIATTSGNLIDHQRGTASLMMTDPTMSIQASPIGLLYNYVLIYMFFTIGGFFHFLQSVALSYDLIPPTAWIPTSLFASSKLLFWQDIIHLGNQLLTIATRLAAPALVALWMSDFFLGIANRMATQVPMTFLGWALKSLVAVGILMISWSFILHQLNITTHSWIRHVNQVVERIAHPLESAPPPQA